MAVPRAASHDAATTEPRIAAAAIHDLRGAVHAIQGFLSVLLSEQPGPLTTTQHDFLVSAYITVRRIERLVGDLQVLEFGMQQLPLMLEDCDLMSAVQVCLRELQPTADGFDVRIHLAQRNHHRRRLVADPVRLEQIVFNLLENAIRYAPPATTVVVRVRESMSRVLLVVENEISGPPPNDPTTWFAPFQRGEHADPRRNGFGVGLTIVQVLAQAHQGRAISRVRGAKVSVAIILPRHVPTAVRSADRSRSRGSGRRESIRPTNRSRTEYQ
jgi:two-component system sensor histidine kinase ChiS